MRDFEKEPYSLEERRVCDYILKITDNQIGCGDDPIGFLIASHQSLSYERKFRRKLKSDTGV